MKTRNRRLKPPLVGVVLALSAMPALATDVQDLVRIKGHERDVLTGLGLVIGLDGSGDKSKDSLVAVRPMKQLLMNLNSGILSEDELAKADTFAIVMVTMNIPPTGAREGDELDIGIETLYNATSLEGGRLVPSLLRLPLPDADDLPPLAMADGLITIEGANPRSGVIRGGGRLFTDDYRAGAVTAAGTMTLVINDAYAGYPVATTIADAINEEFVPDGYPEIAQVIDPKNVKLLLPVAELPDPANFIATVMLIDINPTMLKTPARIVVNERVGSIVVTNNVEISPVAITHDGLTITTITPPPVPTAADPVYETTRWTTLDPTGRATPRSARLQDLLEALKQLQVPAKDQIAILYSLKEAGALHGEIIRE